MSFQQLKGHIQGEFKTIPLIGLYTASRKYGKPINMWHCSCTWPHCSGKILLKTEREPLGSLLFLHPYSSSPHLVEGRTGERHSARLSAEPLYQINNIMYLTFSDHFHRASRDCWHTVIQEQPGSIARIERSLCKAWSGHLPARASRLPPVSAIPDTN